MGYRAIPSSTEIAAGNNILKHYLSSEGSLLNWNIWPDEGLRASHVKGGLLWQCTEPPVTTVEPEGQKSPLAH